MATDRWRQLADLFEGALDQPAGAQVAFLARSCGDDDVLRAEVASMLEAAARSGDFLSEPALELFARQVSREGWSVRPGDRIGSYSVQRRLGAGGMGEVWQARDERLARDVAIKLLLPHPSNAAERVRAFQREARAAGALNHTNVLTVHDVGEHRGAPYLVTECLEGESLRARLRGGGLAVDTSLDIAVQAARGLTAAHARGIVHRDLKPENIFLASDGRVKILDFGLATLHDVAPQLSFTADRSIETTRSLVMGTAGYMAPEQVRGEAVDCRADIFSLGAVLDEMLTGHLTPTLSGIVRRCLSPSPDDRYPSAAALASALDAVVKARSLPRPSVRAVVRRPIVLLMVLLVVGAAAGGGWRGWETASRGRWARTVAAPEIQRFLNHGDYFAAFLMARQALDVLPDDPQLRALWLDVSIPQALATDPGGAEVALAAYGTRSAGWLPLGRTPLSDVRLPRGQIRLRISKAGYQSIEVARTPPGMSYRLDPVASVPPGMVRVAGGRAPARPGIVGTIDDYWIGRFEVTNRQFQAFVEAGGYNRREYWREPFISGTRSLRWEDAIVRFRDSTGRPGPATWVGGTYPDGKADHPVAGVSWYEAAAYAAFVGKALPTVHHWFGAAALGRFADILTASNFTGKGPAAVGEYMGLGPFGTYDMAGNVKEWCATASAGRRFLLGGAYDEPRYVFGDYDASEPFERSSSYGFRVAEYDGPLPAAVTAPVRVTDLIRDGRTLEPVADAIFDVWRRQYAYDREPLNTLVEATEETEGWTKHTVTFDAAYGGERVRAHLFLPRHTSPPYQVVVFFPAGDSFVLRSSRDLSLAWADFVIRSGRALLYPVYKGTYERSVREEMGPNRRRELRLAWSRDLGRAIDYLETRADIDPTRLGFYGVSTGADAGLILTALEPRLKVSVLQGTGIWGDEAPESDAFNYAPRVRVPTLMLNGRYDFGTPLETAQRPLFNLLGTGAEHKRHAVFDAGHALRREDVAREALPWLDRYLGPVVAAPRGR